MFDNWRRERRIRKVLQGLARQRVATILKPHGIWVIEKSLRRGADTDADLATCLMRGWVEALQEDVPHGNVEQALARTGPIFTSTTTTYRLTDGGWDAINRAHSWMLVGVVLAAIPLLGPLPTFVIERWHRQDTVNLSPKGPATPPKHRPFLPPAVPRPHVDQAGSSCQAVPPFKCRDDAVRPNARPSTRPGPTTQPKAVVSSSTSK